MRKKFMRLKKVVPIVGFCAVSFISSSAMAELWAVNCAKQQCLDATTGNPNGKVQVSDCTKSKKAQGWDAQASEKPSLIPNAYKGFGKPCLDIYVKGDPTQNRVVTNRCNSRLQAQLWNFAPNGQVGPIDNYYTQQCLTVASDSTVIPTECNGEPSQRWKWVNVGDTDHLSCGNWPAGLPVYKHIVIVVEENKDYNEIIGNSNAPYINKLKQEGANFTRMYGEEHHSQGNYFWMFSGDNQTVGFTDQVPSKDNNPNYPFTTANLGEQLNNAKLSFKGYAEGLPFIGFTGDTACCHTDKKGNEQCLYARKHVPWISFANVPKSSNLRFVDFPTNNFDNLPTVAFVIPNLENDMHDGSLENSIKAGDSWLKKNIDPYYQWAKDNNSLLIITFDENDVKKGYTGLTNPGVDPKFCAEHGVDPEYCGDLQNLIVTIFAGAHIKPGDYPEDNGITHVNILRTIEAMYGLPKAGAQQPNAAGIGITDDYIITDVFETIE
jgi:hypothetical protein